MPEETAPTPATPPATAPQFINFTPPGPEATVAFLQRELSAAELPPAQQDDYKGAGGKDALKADLADERKKRQAEEARSQALEEKVAELAQFRDSLASLMGGKADEEADPTEMVASLQQQIEAMRTEQENAARIAAVYAATPKGVDAAALLDSRAFNDAIAGVNPADRDALATTVAAFVDANPRFRAGTTGDLYAGGRTATPDPGPGAARIAAAAEKHFGAH